jgi:hypothetical protein
MVMQCDDIKEILVSLLYEEEVSAAEKQNAHQHLETCLACKNELRELKSIRSVLSTWQDEEPPENLVFVTGEAKASWRAAFQRIFSMGDFKLARIGRLVATTAMVVLAFLALSNAEIRWESGKFSFRTSVLGGKNPPSTEVASRGGTDVSLAQGRYTDQQLLEIFDNLMANSEQRQLKYTLDMLEHVISRMELKQRGELIQIKQELNSLSRQVLDENPKSGERPKSF